MTKLLLVRHGQSSTNIEGIFTGHINIPLSDLGIAQAKKTAQYLASNYSVDRVYTSDLDRALDTGKIIAEQFGVNIVVDQDLREINGGSWEGVRYSDLAERKSAEYGVWLTDIGNAACPEGESVSQLQRRVVNAVLKIAQAEQGNTVAVVTHATPIRTLQCFCEKRPVSELKNIPWVSNASVTVVTYENETLEMSEIGQDLHLGELRSTLPKTV